MRKIVLLVALAACKGGGNEDSDVPLDCDTTDPGGMICSVPEECRIECLCEGGSWIEASGCEGQCASAQSLCDVYCQGVGWSGQHCFEPEE